MAANASAVIVFISMKRTFWLFALAACVAVCAFSAAVVRAASPALRIYFIDAEGGQSTLIVTPAGQSMLVDTGWPDFNGRDADRIVTAAHQAGVKRIDFLLITHFHADHVGGVPQLAERIPIRTFMDHGADVETDAQAKELHSAYERLAAKGTRRILKPGDTIPLRRLSVSVLTSNGEHISKALPGAGLPNPACSGVKPMGPDPTENARSAGFLLTYGKFRFIDLGDLTWDKELALMCPSNPIGTVDVFLVSHHGMNISNSPALVWALHPRVAIMNNGAKKGGTPQAWTVVEKSPGLEDLWQLHYSIAGGATHNVAQKFIANTGETDTGFAIELTAQPDGSFSVTNTRNDFTRNYSSP
jgi:competence protein ComEC